METNKSVVAVTTTQTLTNSYALADNALNLLLGYTGTNKFIAIEQESEVMIDVFYTTGAAETSNYLNFTLEFSSDPGTSTSWVQETFDDLQAGVNTHGAIEHRIDGAAAATTYSFSYMRPLCARAMRIKVKETGVAANYGTVTIRVTITPASGQQYNPTETSLSTGALTIGAVDVNQALADDGTGFTLGTSKVFPTGYIADDTATDSVDEGDIGIARMSLDRKQITAGDYVDDTAFTPAGANSYVHLLGAQADDTATDAVDEGDVGAVRMSLDRKLLGAGAYVDDTAFTPAGANSYVVMLGAQADDTATDSVDEGDVGAVRMSLDRKLMITGSYVDDTAFTPAGTNSYGVMMMAQADETGPDSVDEGDAGALRMTLTRFLKTSMGDLLSGEDQTNSTFSTNEKIMAASSYSPDTDTSAAAEAYSVSKASAGNLYGFVATNSSVTDRYFQVFDSSTVPADATVPVISIFCAAGGTIEKDWKRPRAFANGISWAWSSTAATKTIGGSDGIADVYYK